MQFSQHFAKTINMIYLAQQTEYAINNMLEQNLENTNLSEQNIGETNIDEQTLCAIALSNHNVLGAKCLFYEGTWLVAVITSPFYLKSERDATIVSLQEELSAYTQENLLVSCDLGIFRNIRSNMTDIDKQRLFDIVKKRT